MGARLPRLAAALQALTNSNSARLVAMPRLYSKAFRKRTMQVILKAVRMCCQDLHRRGKVTRVHSVWMMVKTIISLDRSCAGHCSAAVYTVSKQRRGREFDV